MEFKLEIKFLEVSYVPTEVMYNKDGKECGGSAPIGRRSIECKHMPQALQDQIVEFITSIEDAHPKKGN